MPKFKIKDVKVDEKDKLPKLFKKQWLKALRSGKYEQGKDMLHNVKENTYCCLGIVGELCGVSRMGKMGFLTSNCGLRGIKSVPKILRSAALEWKGGEIKEANLVVDMLVKMNDRLIPFTEIADWIERNL